MTLQAIKGRLDFIIQELDRESRESPAHAVVHADERLRDLRADILRAVKDEGLVINVGLGATGEVREYRS